MVNSEKLVGTTGYLTLQMRCHINQYRYNWVQLYYIESKKKRNILHTIKRRKAT